MVFIKYTGNNNVKYFNYKTWLLSDLIQANGAIKDIKKFYHNRKVFLLTAQPYAIFMSECPYIDGVIIDKRLPDGTYFI